MQGEPNFQTSLDILLKGQLIQENCKGMSTISIIMLKLAHITHKCEAVYTSRVSVFYSLASQTLTQEDSRSTVLS